ncbi:MAG: peptidoglycan-binding protein LysM [Proteobacteria bacterium]|nr:peptidoglycan-binding protein LysM [Pseudomonadota bacterium]
MGLIDFVKGAGAKVLGIGRYKKEEEEANRRAAEAALVAQIKTLGLKVKDLEVHFEDETATIKGTAPSQQEREKIVLVVGNTQGVARVDDQMEVEVAEPEAVFYTVKSGDTLSKIAKAQYGDAMKYPVIFEANKPMLTSPDLIYPGQVLRIPPLAK